MFILIGVVFVVVCNMTHSKSGRGIDRVRALILAEVLRNNYLEELLGNGKSAEDKTLDKDASSKPGTFPRRKKQ